MLLFASDFSGLAAPGLFLAAVAVFVVSFIVCGLAALLFRRPGLMYLAPVLAIAVIASAALYGRYYDARQRARAVKQSREATLETQRERIEVERGNDELQPQPEGPGESATE
jgi:hypothetical protein